MPSVPVDVDEGKPEDGQPDSVPNPTERRNVLGGCYTWAEFLDKAKDADAEPDALRGIWDEAERAVSHVDPNAVALVPDPADPIVEEVKPQVRVVPDNVGVRVVPDSSVVADSADGAPLLRGRWKEGQFTPPPPGSETDSIGRTLVPARKLPEGAEVEIDGLTEDDGEGMTKFNGNWGTIVGYEGTDYVVHLFSEYGGDEKQFERHNLSLLEPPARKMAPSSVDESKIMAVRVLGLQGKYVHMNGVYRRAGKKGTKFEQRLNDGSGGCILWQDLDDKRWKMNEEDSKRGWLPSHSQLCGQWWEDPEAGDGTAISGQPYPFICRATAAEHTHTGMN